jgi:hypothetical protein
MDAAHTSLLRCIRCALPETFPGVKFDAEGLCNYCAYFDIYREREASIKSSLKKEFLKTIKKVKKERHRYHGIVAYSGGKDSTFLLQYLKKTFGLKILAHTLDNGFVSPTALDNIKRVTDKLKVDSVITKPESRLLKDVFKYSLVEKIPYPKEILAMMSQVCAVCIGMVFGTTLKLAVKHRIPLMFVGFTPGQYPAITLENFLKVRSCLFLSDKVYKDDPQDIIKIISDPVRERFGEKAGKYFFRSQYVPKDMPVPKVLLPYHALLDYDEGDILREIKKLGWVKPVDTDSCSTNCLLNTVGNLVSVKRLGYHPYIGEMAHLVREGKMSRSQALAAEQPNPDPRIMNQCLHKLGLTKI